MTFVFDAPPNERILKRFIGVHLHESQLWWSYEKRKWVPLKELGCKGGSSTAPCNTFKAFKRHVKKHNLKSATLVSRFVGNNIHYDA